MKTYKEMADSVLARSRAVQAARRKKQQKVMRGLLAVSCLCLLAGGGVLLWPILPSLSSPPAALGEIVGEQGRSGMVSTANARLSSSLSAENQVIFHTQNPLTQNNSADMRAKMNIALMTADFVPLSTDQLAEYYGTRIFPTVPDDLSGWEKSADFSGYGIYRRNNGTGDAYYDQIALNYSNVDLTRWVHLEMAKCRRLFICCILDETKAELSTIRGTKAYLWQEDADRYQAAFSFRGTDFVLSAEGLTQNEFIQVLESLVS